MQTNSFALCIFVLEMKSKIETYKGIHPGKIIDRELKKLALSQRTFAAQIGEHSQSINAIITGRRSLTASISLKIEKALGFEDGFLYMLQAYYEIQDIKNKNASLSIEGTPNIRKILFWDTDFDKIDWGLYKKAVIQRVLERGNDAEKAEIMRYYNLKSIDLNNYAPTNSYRIRTEHSI